MKNNMMTTGSVRLEVTCVDPLLLVNQLMNKGFCLHDVVYIDMLIVQMVCIASEYPKICKYLKRHGCQYRVIEKQGWRYALQSTLRRWSLFVGVALVLFATVFLPTRILFIQVTGNDIISSDTILDAARSCGVCFFTSRKQVRSEKVKNALLNALPQLQWAGINTSGCVATIQVEEKKIVEGYSYQSTSENIVANQDGVIYRYTVKKGQLQCRVGQAVQKNQILVSGYRDNGLFVSHTNVDAEIFGVTKREICAVTLCNFAARVDNMGEIVRYSIRIGKKIINMSKGSGIYSGTCDKIYVEECVSLPGGFQLPVSIIREKIIPYEVQPLVDDGKESYSWLASCGRSYTLRQMIAGEILRQQESIEIDGDICRYRASYACVELIGKNKFEGIFKPYGENE